MHARTPRSVGRFCFGTVAVEVDDFLAGVDAHFAVDALHVALHGAWCDKKQIAHALNGVAFHEEQDDLLLPLRQSIRLSPGFNAGISVGRSRLGRGLPVEKVLSEYAIGHNNEHEANEACARCDIGLERFRRKPNEEWHCHIADQRRCGIHKKEGRRKERGWPRGGPIARSAQAGEQKNIEAR